MSRLCVHTLERDIQVFVGEELESVATAIFDRDEVLLVDAMANA
jgi:hypothetical protein